MKRKAALLISTILVFCLAACGTVETISQIRPGALMTGNELVLSRGDVAESEETVVDWAKNLGINAKAALPEEGGGNRVISATADAHNSQTLYLWEEGNAPAVTEYTVNNGRYADDPDFRPYLVTFPVPEGTEVKGAVLICAGGAFQFRSDEMEGTPVAEELASRGYQSFVVNYRLRPYTQEEGALDLSRAVRFVRRNAGTYGIDENNIAVMGFSAGGILAGELPPTFYCYGTRDPFYSQFLENADAVEAAGVRVERLQLDGRSHGFGYREDWFDAYDSFLTDVFSGQ